MAHDEVLTQQHSCSDIYAYLAPSLRSQTGLLLAHDRKIIHGAFRACTTSCVQLQLEIAMCAIGLCLSCVKTALHIASGCRQQNWSMLAKSNDGNLVVPDAAQPLPESSRNLARPGGV